MMFERYKQISYTGFSFCTNGNIDPYGKLKIYFCCHLADLKKYFDVIKKEVWSIFPEIVFWYNEEEFSSENSEQILEDILHMNLIIVLVTRNFIEEGNFSREIVLPYAVEHHIAILPLMIDTNLEDAFNHTCGNLQYVQRQDADFRYMDSLEKYLNSILPEKEVQRRIKHEFSRHLFISYRKKDKKYIKVIQKMVHCDRNMRDVALWYDDYLIPGESFEESLYQRIEQCDIFLLLVTPHLLEEKNYVMEYEYPLAVKMKKRIIPIQVIETDKKQLTKKFKNLPDIVNLLDNNDFSDILKNKGISLLSIDESSEHLYFIGWAYLNGIEVEKDFQRAINIISEAANKGNKNAYKLLISIYKDGQYAFRNLEKAAYWEEKYYLYLLKLENSHIERFCLLRNWGNTFYMMQDYNSALEKYELAFDIADYLVKKAGNDINYGSVKIWKYLSDIYLKKGQAFENLGMFQEAEKCLKSSLKIDAEIDSNEETETLNTRRDFAVSLAAMGDFYLRNNELIKAKHAFKQSVQLLDPSTHNMTWGVLIRPGVAYRGYDDLEGERLEHHYLAYSYEMLAVIATNRLQMKNALQCYRKALLPLYQSLEIEKNRNNMLRLIKVSVWIVLLEDIMGKTEILDNEDVAKELMIFKETVEHFNMLCLTKAMNNLEEEVMNALEMIGFKAPVPTEITLNDIVEYMNKHEK